eukprot:PLAT11732.1.p1 GENE.PLAT11732.1~~PLAT11732.1.p1  ORF type:complete len:243 (-),score=69.41 PLAT11732.1:192-920(-)
MGRLLRQKRNRKLLRFYKLTFDVRPPYKILLDGNLLHRAAKSEVPLESRLRELCNGAVAYFYVTNCVLAELEELSGRVEGMEAAQALAATFSPFNCKHRPPLPAGECMHGVVARRRQKWLVASQDEALLSRLRRLPGVPLAKFSGPTLGLLEPSSHTEFTQRKMERRKSVLSAEEQALVEEAKEELADGRPERKRRIRRGRSLPNPLSKPMSKKRKAEIAAAKLAAPKKKRRRNKKKKDTAD